jgi:hypothetical protein
MVALNWDAWNPCLYVGLTAIICATLIANAAFNVMLRRTLDEEFEVGYRVGYRAGRRTPQVTMAVADLDTFRQRRMKHGGVSQAPVGTLAGDRPPARRDAAYPD